MASDTNTNIISAARHSLRDGHVHRVDLSYSSAVFIRRPADGSVSHVSCQPLHVMWLTLVSHYANFLEDKHEA